MNKRQAKKNKQREVWIDFNGDVFKLGELMTWNMYRKWKRARLVNKKVKGVKK